MKCLQMALLSVTTAKLLLSPPPTFSSSFSLHRQSLPLRSSSAILRPLRCRAAPPSSPPQPPGDDSSHHKDLVASFSKFQDRMQIFFAVLFWMSLFFWASAWDGRNRPNKGSGFRR